MSLLARESPGDPCYVGDGFDLKCYIEEYTLQPFIGARDGITLSNGLLDGPIESPTGPKCGNDPAPPQIKAARGGRRTCSA